MKQVSKETFQKIYELDVIVSCPSKQEVVLFKTRYSDVVVGKIEDCCKECNFGNDKRYYLEEL